MSAEIISIQPGELKFAFELRKLVNTTLTIANLTSDNVAFKVKTTSPKKYSVRPNTGLLPPHSSMEVTVTMQAQKEAPPDMVCKDKFLVQSVVVPPGVTDVSQQDIFNKESGREIHEVKLRVVYVGPQPPSPVAESAEEGTNPSPFPNSLAKGLTPADPNQKDVLELKAKLTEVKSALTVVTEDRNNAHREVQQLKARLAVESAQSKTLEMSKGSSGWSTFTLLLMCIIFFFIGFYVGKPPLPLPTAGHGEL